MIQEGRKEGLRAPLFCLAAVLSTPFFQIAAAQVVNRSDLELCADLETAELKLACFEAIIAASKMPEPAATAEATSPGPKTDGPVNAVSSSTESQVSFPKTAATNPVPASQELDDNFGEEHLDRAVADRKHDVIIATVTNVRRAKNKKLYFHFANGQIWRQMESGYIQYPRTGGFEIEITRGMMGDYRLRVGGKGRMTRVVRME